MRTIGPIVAISVLLDQIHIASLSSCTPVSANWNATTIRITLVAAEKTVQRNPQRALKKEKADADRDGDAEPRSNPDLHAGAGKLNGAKNQNEFGAFADDHQENERADSPSCRARRLLCVGLDALFDVLAKRARDAVHPHDHGDHEDGGNQHQQAFKAVLASAETLKQNGNGYAGGGGQRDCHSRRSRRALYGRCG